MLRPSFFRKNSHQTRRRRKQAWEIAEGLEERLLLATQIIAPQIDNAAIAAGENVNITVQHSTDDDSKSRGISLNVHFDPTKLSFDPATQLTSLTAFGATIVPGAAAQVVVIDEAADDGDALTTKQFTIGWTSQGGTFPVGTELADLFTAQFTALAGFTSGSTNVNFTRNGAAPGFDTATLTPAVITARVAGSEQQIRSDAAAKNVAPAGNVEVPVLYSTDDDTKNRGISVNVHFDPTKLSIDPATQITDLTAFGATIVPGAAAQVVVIDEAISDGDPLTTKQFTIGWTSQGGTFPAGTDLAQLFSAQFTALAGFTSGSTSVNYTRNGAAPGAPNFSGTPTVITVNNNTAPVARDDEFTTVGNAPVSGNVIIGVSPLSADTDVDGDTLTISTTPVTAPTKGSVVLMADGSFTYSPNPDVTGTDSFVYMLSDGRGGTDTATATITLMAEPVNRNPSAGDDDFTAVGTTPLTGNVIISNSPIGADFDEDNDPLTIDTTPVTAPTMGTLVLMADGSFTYTANAAASGTDTFVYTLRDDRGGSDTATVTITIAPENRNPVANDDAFTTQGTTPLTDNVIDGSTPVGIDTDPDGDVLSISTTPATAPTKGSVTLSTNGSFTYTANAGATGTDTFAYTLNDGNGGTDTGTVTITIGPGGEDTFDFDIDQDGTINPFSDAVLLFAWMSAGTPDSVLQTFISSSAPSSVTPTTVRQNLDNDAALFDIDGDGTRNPFQDAVLLFAALSSGTPDSVLQNFISPNAAEARNTPAEIRAYISGLQTPSTSSASGSSSAVEFFDPSEDDDPTLFDFEDDGETAAVFADDSAVDAVFADANDEVSLWKGILGA